MIWIIMAAILFASDLYAANHYIRDGATGTGSDWADACDDFAGSCAVASLVRGDTYYVADGSYAARTFSTAASGTSVITIKKATASDHGTETGWVSTYGDGVATWSCTITFSTPYWVFDGVTGSLHSLTSTDYGFAMAQCAYPFDTTSSSTDITISHVYALASAADTEKLFLEGRASRLTVSHSYLRGFQNCMMTRGAGTKADWVFEYNVNRDMFSSTLNHGECLNANESNLSNLIARYNFFLDWSNDWSTATIVANNSDITSAEVCGNIFKNASGANGLITGTSAGTMSNVKVYNNTFHTFTAGFDNWLGDSIGSPTGNVARNNILMSMVRDFAGNWNTDYDMFVSTTGTLNEANDVVTTTNPFVDHANNNYRLSAGTTAGQTLASCTTDMYGTTRGSDGTWDRGAIEYGTGGDSTPPSAPSGVFISRLND